MAVQDGPVRNLFANTGDLYYGRGFEMLASLEAEFKPATFSHSFAALHEFWAQFEGHLHDMSCSAVSIPPILKAMLFLRALHPRYKAIIGMFASKQKDISAASIDSIVSDAQFMDEFSFFGSNGNPNPVTDDLLDTTSPPELSPVHSLDDDAIPPAEYGPPVDAFTSTSDAPMGHHMPNGSEGDSVLDGIG